MKNEKSSSSALLSNVAASAADRGLTAPNINPLVTVAATLAGRLLGLFRRPAASARAHRPRVSVERVSSSRNPRPSGRSSAKARCVVNLSMGGHSHG